MDFREMDRAQLETELAAYKARYRALRAEEHHHLLTRGKRELSIEVEKEGITNAYE